MEAQRPPRPIALLESLRRSPLKYALAWMIFILAIMAFPYSFSWSNVSRPPTASGFTSHLLVFIPLGYALAYWLRRRGCGRITALVITVLMSAGLALGTEALQFLLPRTASPSDAAGDILGGLIGFALYGRASTAIVHSISHLLHGKDRTLSMKALVITYVVYFLVMLLLSLAFRGATELSSWDDSYPLLVGNERTGDRPWRGQVRRLEIAGSALSKDEVAQAFSKTSLRSLTKGPLLCSYELSGEAGLLDQTGNLPRLVWRGNPEGDNPASLDGTHWLETTEPARFLTEELRRSSQFTLSATVATADARQEGPARIVSLSLDPWLRNFTLGQAKDDLVVRLRTPLTGENGMQPSLRADGVFAETSPRRLIVTYDGSILTVYVDRVENRHTLTLLPEAMLYSILVQTDADLMIGYLVLHYFLLFFPLGYLAGQAITTQRRRSVLTMVLIALGLVLPPLIYALVFTGTGWERLTASNLTLGFVFAAGGVLTYHVMRPEYGAQLRSHAGQ